MIIIIGGSGFIGTYTTEAFLQAGYEVLATGRETKYKPILENLGASYIELDISKKEDFQKLPKTGVEGVILLAGMLPANSKTDISKDENADEYINVNVIGTINVLEYCRNNNIKKMISTTSYADIFNSWKKGVALPDNEPRGYKFTGDHAVYVISKNAATDIILYYNAQHGLQGSIFRLPPVYGVGPHNEIYVNGKYYKTGIQTFIEKAEAGQPIEIWGDPYITRDIIYVKDVAQAFIKAINSSNSIGVYNMTSSTELSLIDQVKTIIDVFGGKNKSEIIFAPEKTNNTPSFLFDNSRCTKDFGWKPHFIDYKDMMIDYKKEMNSGRFSFMINDRRKNG